MNIDDIYGGQYLKADDLKGRAITVKISEIEAQDLPGKDGGKESKVVLSFTGTDKQLVLNKTNASMIAAYYSTETDNWQGKPVELRPEKVPFQGNVVDAIRVYVPHAVPAQPAMDLQAPPQQAAAAAAPAAAASPAAGFDDDLPF